jgi:hypothetical protein
VCTYHLLPFNHPVNVLIVVAVHRPSLIFVIIIIIAATPLLLIPLLLLRADRPEVEEAVEEKLRRIHRRLGESRKRSPTNRA